MTINRALPDLVSALIEVVGDDQVLSDADVMTGYVTDVIGRGPGFASAVVRPSSVDEVSRVLTICRHYTLLHTAGLIARSARRTRLRLAAGWPWANDLVAAFTRVSTIRLRI